MRQSNATIAEETLQSLRELEDEFAAWGAGEMEGESPFSVWMDGCLAFHRVTKAELFRPESTPELMHWEILLGWGGPSILLELQPDGRGSILVAWWSPVHRLDFDGLKWLADELADVDAIFN